MLQISMPLAFSPSLGSAIPPGFEPVATVIVEANGSEKVVSITLQGTIVGESAGSLLDFLKAVSHFIADRWTLHMKELKILSAQGIRHLMQFSTMLRQKGIALEVMDIHPNVDATLQALKLDRTFRKTRRWQKRQQRRPAAMNVWQMRHEGLIDFEICSNVI